MLNQRILFSITTVLCKLFWTYSDFYVSLIPNHTVHTQIDYSIDEGAGLQKIRNVLTYIILHISPLIFSFSMSSCPFLFHTLSLGDLSALCCFVYHNTMWLLSLRPAVLPTQNWAAAPAPACRRLTLLRWSERKWLSAVCKVTSVTKYQWGENEWEVKLQNKHSFEIFVGWKLILESAHRQFMIIPCVRFGCFFFWWSKLKIGHVHVLNRIILIVD